jgi:hypothetical protein
MFVTASRTRGCPHTATARDMELATLVHRAIGAVDTPGRFGARKVFIGAVWVAMLGLDIAAVSRLVGELAAFKRWLVGAQRLTRSQSERTPLVVLARADLVAAMNSALVAASETLADGASYHFVLDPVAASDAYAPASVRQPAALEMRGRVGRARQVTTS